MSTPPSGPRRTPSARSIRREAKRRAATNTDPAGGMNAMNVAYNRAVRLHVELTMTPRWRWHKRARLERDRATACLAADTARAALGANPGGLPLLAILKANGVPTVDTEARDTPAK